MKYVLIDAYNVIRTNPSLNKFEKEKGPLEIVNRFFAMCEKARPKGEKWIVFFDGPQKPEMDAPLEGEICAVFSYELTADELIVEKARFLLNQGRSVLIASNDNEVSEKGAAKISAYDFYDLLIAGNQKKPSRLNKDEKPDFAGAILDALIDAKVVSTRAKSGAVLDSVAEVLDYYGDSVVQKSNKAAAGIEKALREKTSVHPAPDPQKLVQRTIKGAIKKAAGK